MTDSSTTRAAAARGKASDKHERLVAAACRLFYEQGIERTTLADVAAAADVQLGNVYYYFKTKDELVRAVIGAQAEALEEALAALERDGSPASRLKALVEQLAGAADMVARYGCPQASLCTELRKRPDQSHLEPGRLLRTSLAWAEKQFQAMGRSDADDLAVEMITRYEGTAVLTQALGDPSLMKKEAQRIGRWIDSIAASGLGAPSR